MNYLLAILLLLAECAGAALPPLPPRLPTNTNTVRVAFISPNPPTNILFIAIVNQADLPTNTYGDFMVSKDLVHWRYANTFAMRPGTNVFEDMETNSMQFYRFAQYQFLTSTNL